MPSFDAQCFDLYFFIAELSRLSCLLLRWWSRSDTQPQRCAIMFCRQDTLTQWHTWTLANTDEGWIKRWQISHSIIIIVANIVWNILCFISVLQVIASSKSLSCVKLNVLIRYIFEQRSQGLNMQATQISWTVMNNLLATTCCVHFAWSIQISPSIWTDFPGEKLNPIFS